MGKKESRRKKAPTCNFNSRPQTIREEIRGKSESNVKRLHDVNGVLRLKHLQKIALWAGGEASSPSFGAYFGYQLASSREALGIRTNVSSIISCERCEALLQPGLNCKVRIEKNVSKGHHRRNNSLLQNNSVYICQFCSHKNIKPGSLKGYLKTLAASKLICKYGSGTKIVNKASVTDAILLTIPQSDLPKVASVSPEGLLLSSKRDSDSLRMNNLGSNPESDMDAAGPTVSVQRPIPVTSLAKQMQESAAASEKESRSHLLRHAADLVLEADWSEKDDAVMQETPLQESAKAPLGRIIGGTSTRKRKKQKASGDASSIQPESSTSLLGQVNTDSVSSRRRRKSSWSSLKDLTHEEQSKREHYGDLSSIPVPFSL